MRWRDGAGDWAGVMLSSCFVSMSMVYDTGRIRLHGKPDAHIYYSCFRLAGRKDSQDFLAIGDSLKNDIGGAKNAKCGASVLIANGIHRAELLDEGGEIDERKLGALVEKTGIEPDYAMTDLRW